MTTPRVFDSAVLVETLRIADIPTGSSVKDLALKIEIYRWGAGHYTFEILEESMFELHPSFHPDGVIATISLWHVAEGLDGSGIEADSLAGAVDQALSLIEHQLVVSIPRPPVDEA